MHIHEWNSIFISKVINRQTSSMILVYCWRFFSVDTWRKELQNFTGDLNNHQPNIKFAYTSSRKCVSFRDLFVNFLDGELTLDMHIKPTDRHQYLHQKSYHPKHTKCSMVCCLTLNVNRIYSRECSFLKHISEMKIWFLRQGYPKKLI